MLDWSQLFLYNQIRVIGKDVTGMAIPASVLEDWEALTEEDRLKAQSFIRVLLQQRRETEQSNDRPSFPLGVWNGGLLYMSDDFNETPEGFEDYT